MKTIGKILTFSIELTIALTLMLIACFEKTIVGDMKIVLVVLGVLSLIASIISVATLATESYKEWKKENEDDKTTGN